MLVTFLKSLAVIYSVVLGLTRESTDTQVKAAYKQVSRGELRRRGLKDLRLQKPALNKIQYKQRVKEVLRTVKAQNVAKAKFRNLKKVCKEVVKKKGAMSRQ